jgi:hypothetical protein
VLDALLRSQIIFATHPFLLRGLRKVVAEMSLTVLSYNLKRALNVMGVGELLGAVT